jgi:hypothetical protein
MASIIHNDAAEACLRRLLSHEAFTLTAPKPSGHTGVDSPSSTNTTWTEQLRR